MIRAKFCMFFIFVLCLILLVGCSSSTLTRNQAKAVIEASKEYKEFSSGKNWISLNLQQVEALKNVDCLRWEQYRNMYQTDTVLTLTDKGKKFFGASQGFLLAGGQPLGPMVMPLVLFKPLIIEITGITGEKEQKIVEYSWCWYPPKSHPEEVRNIFLGYSFKGKAILGLYDDGWRVLMFSSVGVF